ncbi:MAG: S-layer homology domain-containing protein, partial [Patescibacteria group bacterium]
LYKKGTVQGYPDGTFKPAQTVSRVEALKIIFSGMDQPVRQGLRLSFSDAYNGQWYTDYVATAQSNGVVEGYPDGSFKPAQGVNRVEFLKMLFNSTDLEVDENVSEDPYEDVSGDDWFAPYVQFAKEKNLFPTDGDDFHPGNPMERAEVAEVIYRLILIQQNNADVFSDVLAANN